MESFRNAGFEVLGVLNEPSAASIEFGHGKRQSKSSPETILVYDLGGGTFDASLVKLDENAFAHSPFCPIAQSSPGSFFSASAETFGVLIL